MTILGSRPRRIQAQRQVALLRGVNVGKHQVSMAALAEEFAALGCTAVKTYIQSGNVVFTAPAISLQAQLVAAALERRFGFRIPVVLRTEDELARVIAMNPFPGVDVRQLYMVFLAAPLGSVEVAALRALAVTTPGGEEQLAERGSELYLSLPSGMGRSKLGIGCTGSRLPLTNTVRNWNTVLKLAEMLVGSRA